MSALFVPGHSVFAETWDKTPLTNLIDGWPQMTEIHEASGIVIDADNGGIIYSLNRDAIRYPASVTKILTALLVIEKCSLKETVTMTTDGTQMVGAGSTNANTVVGEEFTVEQCLYMLLLKSANDIANQLAVHVSGSIEAFAALMNERASQLGCSNTHFVNPSGMPDSEHYTTADDLSRIMTACLRNETFLKISGAESITIPPTNKTAESRSYTNHNALIVKGSEYYYEPCIAGKTGYTDAAWRTYIGAARKDGRTLIVVLLRGPDKSDFKDAADLFEYGFRNFERIEVPGGSISLPIGKTLDDTSDEAEPYGDGKVRVRFTYNKLPVGYAVMTEEEYGRLRSKTASEVNEAEPAAEEVSGNPERSEKSTNGGEVFVLIAVLLGVSALIVGLQLVRRLKDGR